MGNGLGRMGVCFVGAAGDSPLRPTNNYSLNMYISDPCDEGLGHSFCYVRPDPSATTMSMTTTPSSSFSSKVLMEDTTTSALFRSISGASVSANTSTALSTSYLDDCSSAGPVSSAFESSTSFTSMPLQPLPRSSVHSGPLTGPIEPGFMSGPIDRGFLSGPLDRAAGGGSSLFSGPLERGYSRNSTSFLRRSLSHSGWTRFRHRSIRPGSMIRGLGRSISRKLSRGQSSIVAPVKGLGSGNKYRESWVVGGGREKKHDDSGCLNPCGEKDASDMCAGYDQNLFQWAQGRAGEDRVHVVVSEEHNWVFVGIYDGFSGPDATDFLLSNLYSFVMKELKGLLWDDRSSDSKSLTSPSSTTNSENGSLNLIPEGEGQIPFQCRWVNHSNETNPPIPYSVTQDSNPELNTDSSIPRRKRGRNLRIRRREGTARRRWKYEWDRERIELDRRLKEHSSRLNGTLNSKTTIDHSDVLKALSRALKKTEEAYFDIADKMLNENPELALMGSCVLAMLIKGEDVYVMNVGDSRAVLGQKTEPDLGFGKIDQDLERINEETLYDLEVSSDASVVRSSLCAVQLTMEHSTYVQKEVKRIRDEHPDDPFVISNDRVKGALKLTRAFGAGFLKQRKWNDELLKMFRIDYVGTSPYLNCLPSLHHHRLSPKDKFLILSSDGLYQYFTIEEAVSEVELFVSMSPEGDPAQHLVEEVLLRAAKRAGMDFYELLTIPQGERRRYHDDVSIIVISFEGRIWRSSCVRMSFPEEKPGE